MRYGLLISLALVGAMGAAGCRTAALINPPPISFARLPPGEVEAAIYQGCSKRKWMPTKVRDGLIQATLYQRSHLAVVDIDYDDDSFRVTYVRSENLRYKTGDGEQRIHSSYNKWVKNLVGDIETALNDRRTATHARRQINP